MGIIGKKIEGIVFRRGCRWYHVIRFILGFCRPTATSIALDLCIRASIMVAVAAANDRLFLVGARVIMVRSVVAIVGRRLAIALVIAMFAIRFLVIGSCFTNRRGLLV